MKGLYKVLCFTIIPALLLAGFDCYAQANRKQIAKTIAKFYDTTDLIKPYIGFREFKSGNKTIVIYGTNHFILDPNHREFTEIEEQINKLAPTLILTEGTKMAYPDRNTTASVSGDIGFCRYLAYQKNIEVASWDEYRGHLYYQLVKKYNPDDIYMELYGSMLNDLNFTTDSVFNNYYATFSRNNFQDAGFPVTYKQQQGKYFRAIFESKMHTPFRLTGDSAYHASIVAKLERYRYKDIHTQFLAERDLYLLKVISTNLLKHDRIFIQCGSAHLRSLQNVIMQALSLKYTTNAYEVRGILQKQALTADTVNMPDNTYVKAFNVKGRRVVFWATKQKQDFINDNIAGKMQQVINKLSPTMILVPNFKLSDSTAAATYAAYGQEGLCRFIAEDKKIPLNTWTKYWSYSYYDLSKKYTADRAFYAIIFDNLYKYQNAYLRQNHLPPPEDYYLSTTAKLELEGLPIYKLLYFNNLYGMVFNNLPKLAIRGSILDKASNVIHHPAIAPIIADLEKLKYEELLLKLQETVDNGTDKRIFVQTDWDYIKHLYDQ